MIGLILLVLFFDVLSKYIVDKLMIVNESINVIDNFFKLTYVQNTGAAWSILENNTFWVSIISALVIIFIIWYVYENKPKLKLDKIGYSFIIGGAFGNFIDRIIFGYVVDFLNFNIFGYNFPIFNLADTFIVLGVIILMISSWRYKDYGDKSN